MRTDKAADMQQREAEDEEEEIEGNEEDEEEEDEGNEEEEGSAEAEEARQACHEGPAAGPLPGGYKWLLGLLVLISYI
jgi:hypothetical protein